VNRLALAATIALSACASAESGAPVDAAVGRIDSAILSRDSSMADMSSTDAPPANGNCTATLTCPTAMALGTVSGDTGAAMLSASGYQAAWFRVRVTEDYSDAPGLALRVLASLTSPSGASFDAFVYVNAATDTIECNTTTGTVTTNGNVKDVRAEWGEGFVPNGADDSRDVTIEVRPSGGTSCSSAQSWQLQIEGNWL
jgi:hypothetical protein